MPSSSGPSCLPSRIVLETTDLDRSARFYQALVGWQLETIDDGVTACLAGGDEVARLCSAAESGWVTLFSAADPEATADRARSLGGRLTPRPEWGNGAWQLDEPSGTRLGLEPQRGDRSWDPRLSGLALAELSTWSLPLATAFCADVLGLTATPLPEDSTEFHVLLAGSRPVAGMLSMANLYPAGTRPHWLPYLGTEDCALTLLTAVELGARVRVPLTDTVLGRYAVVEDPAGAAIGLIRPVTESAYRQALAAAGV